MLKLNLQICRFTKSLRKGWGDVSAGKRACHENLMIWVWSQSPHKKSDVVACICNYSMDPRGGSWGLETRVGWKLMDQLAWISLYSRQEKLCLKKVGVVRSQRCSLTSTHTRWYMCWHPDVLSSLSLSIETIKISFSKLWKDFTWEDSACLTLFFLCEQMKTNCSRNSKAYSPTSSQIKN